MLLYKSMVVVVPAAVGSHGSDQDIFVCGCLSCYPTTVSEQRRIKQFIETIVKYDAHFRNIGTVLTEQYVTVEHDRVCMFNCKKDNSDWIKRCMNMMYDGD